MHHQGGFRAFPLHLTDRLDVRKGFNVTHGAANLRDHKIVIRLGAQDLNAPLDFVGDVRNDLHGLPEVFPTTFFVDHTLVNATRCDVVGLGCLDIQKTLVMPEVQIGFRPIHRDVAFTMLIGVERARIHIDVGIEFLDGHAIASSLQEFGKRSTYNALAQAAAHTSRDKNVPAVATAGKRFNGRGRGR